MGSQHSAAERIGVSVKNGVVELDGHVDFVWEKYAAERAAMRVANVKAVASEIKVDPPSSALMTRVHRLGNILYSYSVMVLIT